LFDLGCLAGLMVGSDDTALLSLFLLRIGFVRIPDTIVCLGTLVWLFSPAWDTVELTLEAGGIYPFVVIDPTDLGATTVVAPGQMIDDFLSIPDAVFLPLYLLVLKLVCLLDIPLELQISNCF
jgi:hypothetical protein